MDIESILVGLAFVSMPFVFFLTRYSERKRVKNLKKIARANGDTYSKKMDDQLKYLQHMSTYRLTSRARSYGRRAERAVSNLYETSFEHGSIKIMSYSFRVGKGPSDINGYVVVLLKSNRLPNEYLWGEWDHEEDIPFFRNRVFILDTKNKYIAQSTFSDVLIQWFEERWFEEGKLYEMETRPAEFIFYMRGGVHQNNIGQIKQDAIAFHDLLCQANNAGWEDKLYGWG